MIAHMLNFFLSLSIIIPSAQGYAIHESCNPRLQDIKDATTEALNIADYAMFRTSTNSPALDEELMQDFVGEHPKNYLYDRLKRMRDYMGNFGADWRTERNVVIVCGTNHLEEITVMGQLPAGTAVYKDKNWEPQSFYVQLTAPKGCPTNVLGVTYRTSVDLYPGPRPFSIIQLCDGPTGALGRKVKFGDDWKKVDWEGKSYDYFLAYLPTTILHEALHTGPDGLRGFLQPRIGNAVSESYSWYQYSQLDDELKVQNAESYTSLATALWLRYNELGEDGLMEERVPVDQRPERGPHMYA